MERAIFSADHDYWQDPQEHEHYTLEELFDLHTKWFEEFDIHYLDGRKTTLVVEDVALVGFDGWYANPKVHALTNDVRWMPTHLGDKFQGDVQDLHAWMLTRAYRSLARLYMIDYGKPRKTIGLSHFPLMEGDYNGNPRWMDHFTDLCDIVCFGHSHKQIIGQPVGCDSLAYNAGSDYGNIRTLFIEV